MRVVVTRPESSGARTAALLGERGHDPVLLPLTQPVHAVEAVTQALAKRPAGIAITSAEAMRALKASGVNISALKEIPVFAVGSQTAKAARGIGFQNVLTGESDGRALASLIAETLRMSDFAQGPLLYLAGNPREGGLEEALREAGISLRVAEVYEMRPVEWTAAEIAQRFLPTPDAILLYSRETARAFFALISSMQLSSKLDHARFICISEKVRSVVPAAFGNAAYVSATPSEAAMFDLLDQIAGT